MPSLSVVVCLKESARQAENALYSLSPRFQRNVAVIDYEVLVVEAPSRDELGAAKVREYGDNFRYLRGEDASDWRARALELGASASRAPFLGLLLDGAQILTDRALEHALLARSASERPLVIVPSYRLEDERVDWRADSHLLFSKARFGPANLNGFLGPLLGASCLFVPVESYRAAGGAPAGIERPGGGPLSLALYTNLSRLPGTVLFVLAGEGAFRQGYPEVAALDAIENDVHAIIADRCAPLAGFRPAHREPIAFGPIPGPAQRFLVQSAEVADFHCKACEQRGEPSWFED